MSLQNRRGLQFVFSAQVLVIGRRDLARLVIEFQFAQVAINARAFLFEMVFGSIDRSPASLRLFLLNFLPHPRDEIGIGALAHACLPPPYPTPGDQDHQNDSCADDHIGKDPEQETEALGFGSKKHPVAVFGDKKGLDLLGGLALLQLFFDNRAHLLREFGRRVRNREVLTDRAAKFRGDLACLLVEVVRAGGSEKEQLRVRLERSEMRRNLS